MLPDRRRPGSSIRRSAARVQLVAPAPPAATPPLRRREAWLRIFVVGCSSPCDPPVGGHSCNGRSYHASIARSVTRADRQPNECFRMTAGVRTGKAQNEQPVCSRNRTSDLRVNEYELPLDRHREARSRRRAPGRDARRGSSGRATEISIAPVFDTSRKSLLSPKERDVSV